MSEESHLKPHVSTSQQPERSKTHKQLPVVDETVLGRKTDPVLKKMPLRPSPGKSATPFLHHTTPKSTGELNMLLNKLDLSPPPPPPRKKAHCVIVVVVHVLVLQGVVTSRPPSVVYLCRTVILCLVSNRWWSDYSCSTSQINYTLLKLSYIHSAVVQI